MDQVTPAETLINTAVCLQHMGKPQFISTIMTYDALLLLLLLRAFGEQIS